MSNSERPIKPPNSREHKRQGSLSPISLWRQGKAALLRALKPHEKLVNLAVPALFVGCVVHLLSPLLAPLETPSRMVLSLAGAHLTGASDPKLDLADRLLVLKIDRATFRARASVNNPLQFNGISPLDRCVLLDRLGGVLEAMPKLEVLGIDLDLSPTGQPGQDQCGLNILKLLGEKKELKSILILPIDAEERAASDDWRKAVREHKLALASPDLLTEYGLVRRHELLTWHSEAGQGHLPKPLCPSLGVAMAIASPELRLHQDLPKGLADSLGSCFEAKWDAERAALQAGFEKLERDEHNIAFQHLGKRLAVPEPVGADASFKPLSEQLKRPGIEKVRWAILGADFDRSDSFRTPLGELSGVEVHAAIATDPAESVSHGLSFVLDFLLGMAFGWFVHHVWRHYFDQRLGLHPSTYVDAEQRAYLILVGLLLVWLLLALLILPALSLTALLKASLWINPVPMLIGMSVDAFIVGSVKVALELLEHSGKKAHEDTKRSNTQAREEQAPPDPTAKRHTAPSSHRRRGRWLLWWHGCLEAGPWLAWWAVLLLTAYRALSH